MKTAILILNVIYYTKRQEHVIDGEQRILQSQKYYGLFLLKQTIFIYYTIGFCRHFLNQHQEDSKKFH